MIATTITTLINIQVSSISINAIYDVNENITKLINKHNIQIDPHENPKTPTDTQGAYNNTLEELSSLRSLKPNVDATVECNTDAIYDPLQIISVVGKLCGMRL